jgi:hypothetical protein
VLGAPATCKKSALAPRADYTFTSQQPTIVTQRYGQSGE